MESIAERFPSEVVRLRLLLIAAVVLLAVGLVTPIITLEKFIVVRNTFSVVSGVTALLHEKHYFLFLVVAVFSILLPILKFGVLFRLTATTSRSEAHLQHYLKLMHDYGKWSMLDVFVVAILVVAVKLGAIADVQMRYGLYAFATAVLLTMYVTARVVHLTELSKSDEDIH